MLMSSCKSFYPSRMLTTDRLYPYSKMSDSAIFHEYRIAPNDEVSVLITTNNGENLLDPISGPGGSTQQVAQMGKTYLVEFDGMVNLPLIKRVKISGLTLREAESLLEEKFNFYYNKPYVQIKVTNNRVIIFPGGLGGTAQVLRLENTNTTLFEALARAGGIADGKAYRIKLIRGNLNDRKVYLIDLSKLSGLKDADIVLMANDIIYVEPVYRVPQTILAQFTPYMALVTTFLVVYGLFK